MQIKMNKILDKARNQLQEVKKRHLRIAIMCLILLSLIFFLTMLIGSAAGSVDLNKFTFDEPISKVLNRKSIKFTLLGYCIDDKCTRHVSHDFNKAPSSDEIKSGEVHKRSIDAPEYNHLDIGDVENVGEKAGDIGKDVGEKAGDVGKDVGEKAGEIGEAAVQSLTNALLSAFDNFAPKQSTSGKSGWIARPIIAAAIFNVLVLLLLLFTNEKNMLYCYGSAIILLAISFLLNVISFFITFSLFSLVFNVIGAFPGIGDNRTGVAIYLSGWSSSFLFIALILILIDGGRAKSKDLKKVGEAKDLKEAGEAKEFKEIDL